MLLFSTPFGAVQIELDPRHAPKTVAYFQQFAIQGGFDASTIFRVTSDGDDINGEEPPINVLQIGSLLGLDAPRQCIEHESTDLTGIRHRRWSISAARFAPGEVYGSFFVCMRDEPSLDYGGARQPDGFGYAAFGMVVSGQQALLDAHAAARQQAVEILSAPIPFHILPTKGPTDS